MPKGSIAPPSKSSHLLLGQKGEDMAADFLKNLGYEIRERNVRLGHDEIDIVAFDSVDNVIVFAEVKTRKIFHEDFRPELNAGFRKCKKLKRSARKWVALHKYDGGYRLDLLCIAGGKVISHVKELAWD